MKTRAMLCRRPIGLAASTVVTIILRLWAPAGPAFASDDLSDGPHFFYQGDSAVLTIDLRHDSLIEYSSPVSRDPDTVRGSAFLRPVTWHEETGYYLRKRPGIPRAADSATRILAISDIHGDYDHLVAFLRKVGVVDSLLQWSWGDGRLVVVGDIMDRGAQVTECLWLLHRLQVEAQRADGGVHVLLGNHELMVLRGDLRYVNEKYTEGIVHHTGTDYSGFYGPDTELGRWLRTCNTVMTVNDALFVHGGLAPWLAESNLTPGEINDSVRAAIDLTKDELVLRQIPRRLFGTDGPFWYRGYHYAMEDKYSKTTADELDDILAHFDVDFCVIGHSEIDSVMTLFDGRVIAVDVPVEEIGGFEGLLWQDGQAYRVTVSGQRVPLKLRRQTSSESGEN